ncbi:MAG TPA: TrbI/VirB10 family protein, partial [Novosphingobium sp.]|nr:TrbI/VirB10 family protein [Novosphingobium sp.]
MTRTDPLARRFAKPDEADPREGQGAEIIDLATRQVLPQVAVRRPRSEAAGLMTGLAVVAALGAVTLWSMDSARRETAPPPAPAAPAPVAQAPFVPAEAVTPMPGAAQPAPEQTAVLAAPPQTEPMAGPAANPYSNPTIVFDASALPLPRAGVEPGTALAIPAPGTPGAPTTTGNGNEDFAARLGGVGGSAATATASIDPKTTVTQGTLIPAVLETAIDTDVPGFVRAVVSADVRSFDGTRVLVPRSSRLIGQYRSGMQAGQKRAYDIWTRLIRPDGVSVAIATPAIGFAGETGLA